MKNLIISLSLVLFLMSTLSASKINVVEKEVIINCSLNSEIIHC